MTKINPKIFIGLGVIVTISSLLQERMKFFLIFGIGFIIWGVVGLIQATSNRSKPSQREEIRQKFSNQNHPAQHSQGHQQNMNHSHQQATHNYHNNNTNNNNHHQNHTQHVHSQHNANHTHPHHQQTQVSPHTHKRCPSCHRIIEKTYRFCPHCGYGV